MSRKIDLENLRTRSWSCICYLPFDVLDSRLRASLGRLLLHYAFIRHLPDSDSGVEHIHCCLYFNSPVRFSAVRDLLTDFSSNAGNCFAEKLLSRRAMVFSYFIHSADRDKIHYSIDDICSDDLQFWDFEPTISDRDKSFEILNRLLRGDKYFDLVRDYGKDFVYHVNQFDFILDKIKNFNK